MSAARRVFGRTAPTALYVASGAAVVGAMGFGAAPLSWLVLLVGTGALCLACVAHGVGPVSFALRCLWRDPDTAHGSREAALVWWTISGFSLPVGVMWGLVYGVHGVAAGADVADLTGALVAPAYGLALLGLATETLQRLTSQRRGDDGGGLLVSGMSAATMLPALAVVGLVLS